MEKYMVEKFKDTEVFSEKAKLKETTVTINTVMDAQEAIIIAIAYILKKKNMNYAVCSTIISDAVVAGLDSGEDIFKKVTPDTISKATKKITVAVVRKLMAYVKTK